MKLSESIIVIVDDDEEVVLQAKKILENLGVVVLSAYDVPSALTLLNIKKPHLIITDLEMSPKNGFYFLSKLKDDSKNTDIPVMVLSAKNNKDSVYTAISYGACDYIVKPLKASSFIRKIQRVLKDQDYLKYDFTASDNNNIDISVPGSFQSAGVIGIRIESNVCFNPVNSVVVKSDRPELFEMSSINFAIHSKSSSSVKGMFNTELIAVPVNSDFIEMKKRC